MIANSPAWIRPERGSLGYRGNDSRIFTIRSDKPTASCSVSIIIYGTDYKFVAIDMSIIIPTFFADFKT